MKRQFSDAARDRLLEPWEEYVGYVYDDKRGKVHGKYIEWDGGPVRGTLTIGFGHTNAAGGLIISQGLRLSREEAGRLLSLDLAPVVAAVNRLLRVDVTQHQFDALCDAYFNCPAASVAAIRLVNAGRAHDVPAKLLQYVYAKGERMEGLVRRRNAEIAWFHLPDEIDAPEAPHPDIVHSPKAERNPPPKPLGQSKSVLAGGGILCASIAEAAQALSDLLHPIIDAKGSLDELGLLDGIKAALHEPVFGICLGVCALAAFIIWDRRRKLINEHV